MKLRNFFGLREITSKIKEDDNFIHSFVENGNVKSVIPSVKINAQVQAITDIANFGTVDKKILSDLVQLKKSKESQAQIVGSQTKSIIEIEAVFVQSKGTNGTDITGCDILPDGRVVLSNYYNPASLIILSNESDHFEIQLEEYIHICDVAVIDSNRVAVACSEQLLIVDILNKRVSSSIPTMSTGFGLVYLKDTLVCLTSRGIKFVNVDDCKVERTIGNICMDSFPYISSFNERFYYSDSDDKTIKCIDKSFTTIWSFKDTSILQRPWGIAVDENGYMY